jgi:hypothetical protein
MKSREELKDLIYEVLRESQIVKSIYQSMCLLETVEQENLTEILTAIRALKGVTVVTMVEPHALVTAEKAKSVVNIKFIPARGYTLNNYLHHLTTSVINIPGVHNIAFKKIEPMDTAY